MVKTEEALLKTETAKQTFKRGIFNSIRGTTSLLILITVKSVLPDLVFTATRPKLAKKHAVQKVARFQFQDRLSKGI